MVMVTHCIGHKGLRVLKMLNFTEEEEANEMQRVMVELDIYCSKQTKDLFERFRLRQRHQEPNEPFDSFVDVLRISQKSRCVCPP